MTGASPPQKTVTRPSSRLTAERSGPRRDLLHGFTTVVDEIGVGAEPHSVCGPQATTYNAPTTSSVAWYRVTKEMYSGALPTKGRHQQEAAKNLTKR